MHELALCQSVLDVMREQASIYHFERVTTVRLEIGALSCVSRDAIEFCFAAVTRDTLADCARLEVIDVLGQAWCLDCETAMAIRERYDACPRCGGYQLQILQGEEMRIKDLEVA